MCSAFKRRSSFGSLRRAAALASALVLCAVGFGQGKGDGVEALFVSAKTTDARPGEIVTASVRVTNHSPGPEEFIESIDLPTGWLSVIAPSSFALGPGESIARILSIAVPRTAPAGPQTITYSVHAQRDPAVRDADTATIGIVAVTGLETLLIDAPSTVLGGESYTARFQVVNRGNSAVSVRAEVLSGHGYPARVEPDRASLEPGGVIDVSVTVTTKPDLAARVRHSLQLAVRAEGDSEAREPAVGASLVDVIPRVNVKFDPRHRIPARLTVSAMGGGDGFGAQVELAGSGTLDEAGRREVEFLLRGPDAQHAGLFGKRAELRVGFATDSLSVRLGDHAYEQSRLTEAGRYGRGGEVSWRPNDTLEFGMHHATDRWGDSDLHQVGAHVDARFDDETHLRLNHLRRSQRDPAGAGDLDDALTSLEADYRPRDDLHVAAEYARNERRGRLSTTDDAYRVELDGSWRHRAYYSFSTVHAGPDYYGAYRDCDYTQAALSVPLSERLQTHASWNSLRMNLEGRTDGRGGTDEQMLRLGARYAWSRDLSTSVEVQDLSYHDPLPARAFDRSERAVRLGVSSSGERLSLRADLTVGTQRDHQLDTSGTVTYYGLHAAYRFDRDRLVSVYGSGGGRGPADARLLVPSGNLGLSAMWGMGERLRLQTSYTAYRDSRLGNQLDLQAIYGEPEATNWSLRARLGGGAEDAVILSWSRPLELPGARKTSVGGLRGRVYDAEAVGEPGLPNAIVSLGELTAATDRQGRFSFGSLPPGGHRLVIDSASVGLNRVPTERVPLAVTVEPGRAAEVAIGIITAAQVGGRVILQSETTARPDEGYITGGPGGEQDPSEPRGLEGILVELDGEGEVHRRVTNARGEFLFDRLRPGEYRFRAYAQNLPPFHAFENPECTLATAAGEMTRTEVRVVAQKRRIHMIDAAQEPDVIRLPEAPGAPTPSNPPAPWAPSSGPVSPGDLREGGGQTGGARRVLSLDELLRPGPPTITDQ